MNMSPSDRLCGTGLPDQLMSTQNQATVEFRTDASVSGRGWRLHFDTTNNNTIGWPFNGYIESPNYPFDYPDNTTYEWRIYAPVGATITLYFNAFSIHNIATIGYCSGDRLEVYEGDQRDDDSRIAILCGAQQPQAITSTGQSLLLRFTSNELYSSSGFRINYVIDACTEERSAVNGPGTIQISKNEPSQCYYRISSEPGTKIQLRLTAMQVANTACEASSLRVYNGDLPVSDFQLLEICGNPSLPKQTQSTGSEMIVVFTTDSGSNSMSAVYQSLAGGCGAHYIKEEGTFTSPNYPNTYPHNSDCEWLIDTSEGNTVNLYFTDFHLEGSGSFCYFDYVRVYDGANNTAPLLGTYCGNYSPEPVRGTSNEMFVHFQSDSSISYGGFSASFNTETCGEIVQADEGAGSISSSNYPDFYDFNTECRWTIKTVSTEKILLVFSHLDIWVDTYTGNTDTCQSADYIQIYEGREPDSTTPKYCGTRIPPRFESAGNTVRVYLNAKTSPNGQQRHGFYATYSTAVDTCGGEFWAESGAFTSPGYSSGAYPVGTTCEWLLTSSPGNWVAINFDDFDLQAPSISGTCYDYVELREDSSTGKLINKFCGSNLPANVTTYSSHVIYVKFYSNTATVGRGFSASWSHSYGGSLVGSGTGQIASPLYPHSYPVNLDVTWTLYVRYNHIIQYEWLAFATEAGSGTCVNDYVILYDGPDRSASQIGRYCGQEIPENGVTETDTLTIYFKSDAYFTDSGWWLNWTDAATGHIPDDADPPELEPNTCGNDYVIAPDHPMPLIMNYSPNKYPAGMDCYWNLYATKGSRILFTVTYLDLEGTTGSSCYFDYIQLFDGPSNSYPEITKICGRATSLLPIKASSTSDMMTVRFRTDSSINYQGFNATYERMCGGTKNARSGTIMSPNYPNGYPDNTDCEWLIEVTNGLTVDVNFNSVFNIDSGNLACNESADYLELRNGADDDAPPLSPSTRNSGDADAYFCGSTAPVAMSSSGNQIKVRFISDGNHTSDTTTYAGFQMSWNAVGTGCGGEYEITDESPTGWFTTPNYPDNYDLNDFCIWTIRAGYGKQIQLDFSGDFDIEDNSACVFDYVKIYDDEFNHDEPTLGTYCGTNHPDTVRSLGNVMVVKFRSDVSITGRGFNATYSSPRCGGMYTGMGGIISYDDYPDPYPSDAFDCEYVLRAPLYHNVQASFSGEFSVPGSMFAQCNGGDYVEFRDYRDAGFFYVRNPDSNLVVTINSAVNSDNVEANTHQGLYSQLWLWDFDHIVSVYDNTKVLAADGANPDANTNVHVETFTGADYQRWERTSDGKLLNKNSTNLVLTILGSGNAGSTLGLRANASNSVNQVWEFEHTYIGRRLGIFCGNNIPTATISSAERAMIVRHHSENGNSGRWQVTWEASEDICGGPTTGSSGIIASPNFPNQPDSNRGCTWMITVNSDRSVKLQFMDVNLGIMSCYYDYVKVYNGIRDQSPLFWDGTICQNRLPTHPFISTGNTMKVEFEASGFGYNAGFRANYTSDEPRFCGGELNIANTTDIAYIANPGYPDEYPNNTECEWLISTAARANQTIYFEFIELDLEDHATCEYDRIEFSAPLIDSLAVYNTVCGRRRPLPYFALPTTSVDVVFQSDDLGHGTFNMSYSIKPCGGYISGSTQGTIWSPNYPDTYNHDDYCVWLIEAEPGHSISVQFDLNSFDVEQGGSDCRYDAVSLYNGPSIKSPEIGRYCNNTMPPSTAVHTSSNYLTILFTSDFSISHGGFVINWETDNSGCGNQLIHSEYGSLQSPNNPNTYPANSNCFWTIFTNPSDHVKFTFTTFDLEGSMPSCSWDYVTFHSGDSLDAPMIGGRICGSATPEPIESSQDKLFIRFRTDGSVQKNGFAGNWETVCGQTIESTGEPGESGMILSPNYPVDYPNNYDCEWKLVGSDTSDFVRAHFVAFDLEGGSSCQYDSVSVYRGDQKVSSQLLGKYCGTEIPPSQSVHGTMLINFVSDFIITSTGFRIDYDFESCGGTRSAPSGEINGHTPTDNWNEHRNLNCTWTIEVDEDKIVELRFTLFDIEFDTNCNNDYIAIYDGPSKVGYQMIGKYCGSVPPAFVRSTSRYMTLEYVTDFYETKDGFIAEWRQTIGPLSGCGGELTTNTGSFSSPAENPGDNYENNLNCNWRISVSDNKIIQLEFSDFVLENHSSGGGCYDYVEVIDGQLLTDHVIYRQCGNQTNIGVIRSSANFMIVRFKTDASITAAGFNASYTVADRDCGATFIANSTLTGFGYDFTGIAGNSQIYRCSWIISASSDTRFVDMRTLSLDVPGSSDSRCADGYVEYRDVGLSSQYGQVLRYCNADGGTVPPEFFSLSETMSITLRNARNQNSSFTAQFSDADCSRTYTAMNGRIFSAGWPHHYAQYLNCQIRIQVPEGNKIQLYFNEFDVEDAEDCNMDTCDHLDVYNSTTIQSNNFIGRYHGNRLPSPIFPNTNNVLLHFVSDQLVSGRGFDISYAANIQGCGGNLTGTHGNVYLTGYPTDPYPANQVCIWHITVPQNRQVTIHFRNINVRYNIESNSCYNDYVAAYEGITDTGPWLRAYCGRGSVSDVSAQSNQMTLVWRAGDSSDSDRAGFTGWWIEWES